MHVLVANGIGPADDFIAAGGSAAWDTAGKKCGALDAVSEGLLFYDTQTGACRREPIG